LVLAVPTSAELGLTATERAFLVQINEVRALHGVAPVSLSDNLTRAARFHSTDMVERGYFEHGAFWRRLERFGVSDGNTGEVLGWDSRLNTAVRGLAEQWLQSPGHRLVVLSDKYREVGIGVAFGPFKGFPRALVVTADFSGPLEPT
jgi:uncharacterized protein YkwD